MKNDKTAATATKTTTKTAPAIPIHTNLPLTDPRRKLTRDEWKGLTKEEKAARKIARVAVRGPIKGRMVKIVLKLAMRAERLSKAFDNEKSIQDTMNAVAKNLRNVSADVDELADNWLPSGRKVENTYAAGDKVQLIDGKVKHFEDLLGEPIGVMEVINSLGRRVACKTSKGARLFLEARFIKAATK